MKAATDLERCYYEGKKIILAEFRKGKFLEETPLGEKCSLKKLAVEWMKLAYMQRWFVEYLSPFTRELDSSLYLVSTRTA